MTVTNGLIKNSFYWSPEELEAYEEAEKKKRDYLSSLEQKFDEGMALKMLQKIGSLITILLN